MRRTKGHSGALTRAARLPGSGADRAAPDRAADRRPAPGLVGGLGCAAAERRPATAADARHRLEMAGRGPRRPAQAAGATACRARGRLLRGGGSMVPRARTATATADAGRPADPGVEGRAPRGAGDRDRLSLARPELEVAVGLARAITGSPRNGPAFFGLRDGVRHERRRTGRKSPRCAIYTRKSTEEGLEQDFNSLDAQREACAAYVLSQKHEGWANLPAAHAGREGRRREPGRRYRADGRVRHALGGDGRAIALRSSSIVTGHEPGTGVLPCGFLLRRSPARLSMRIAQIAPLAESVPPKFYGGTERIVSYLTEELVRQGHEVTLFASGDFDYCGPSQRLHSNGIAPGPRRT